MEAELTTLDTATVEAEWLRELLMDLPVVEKPIPAIPMSFDNQTVIIKVVIKTCEEEIEIYQENEKLQSYCIGLYPNILKIWQIPSQRVYHAM
jgi:hypothetical protein